MKAKNNPNAYYQVDKWTIPGEQMNKTWSSCTTEQWSAEQKCATDQQNVGIDLKALSLGDGSHSPRSVHIS